MNSASNIRQINAETAFAVRHPVLREGKPIDSCRFDGDELFSTTHYGYYAGDELSGIVSVFENPNRIFPQNQQFQLRGMAVLENYRKKGIGEALLSFAEAAIRKNGGQLIWFNARQVAIGFYERCGYKIAGDPFEIPGVGPHYVMFKKV